MYISLLQRRVTLSHVYFIAAEKSDFKSCIFHCCREEWLKIMYISLLQRRVTLNHVYFIAAEKNDFKSCILHCCMEEWLKVMYISLLQRRVTLSHVYFIQWNIHDLKSLYSAAMKYTCYQYSLIFLLFLDENFTSTFTNCHSWYSQLLCFNVKIFICHFIYMYFFTVCFL